MTIKRVNFHQAFISLFLYLCLLFEWKNYVNSYPEKNHLKDGILLPLVLLSHFDGRLFFSDCEWSLRRSWPLCNGSRERRFFPCWGCMGTCPREGVGCWAQCIRGLCQVAQVDVYCVRNRVRRDFAPNTMTQAQGHACTHHACAMHTAKSLGENFNYLPM